MFDFQRPVYCRKKVNNEESSLKLSFPGITPENFQTSDIESKLNDLKNIDSIKNVVVTGKSKPINQVNLKIYFKQEHNKPHNIILKWSKFDDPYRLIIDIFTEHQLKQLEAQSNILLYAQNQTIIDDHTTIKHSLFDKRQQPRIIIDSGHGGHDPGASKYNLKEKDLTLDIAQRIQSILTHQGYKALLTRNQDRSLSLLERSELAEQLNADLFISIHVNSTMQSSISGIETYYIREEYRVPDQFHAGGYFTLGSYNHDNIKHFINILQTTHTTSSHLASSIQQHLLQELHHHNFTSKNRGIKEHKSRLLLRSLVPSALVEVGFLSHPEEAQQLAQKSYRTHLAQGISNGIIAYIQHHYCSSTTPQGSI